MPATKINLNQVSWFSKLEVTRSAPLIRGCSFGVFLSALVTRCGLQSVTPLTIGSCIDHLFKIVRAVSHPLWRGASGQNDWYAIARQKSAGNTMSSWHRIWILGWIGAEGAVLSLLRTCSFRCLWSLNSSRISSSAANSPFSSKIWIFIEVRLFCSLQKTYEMDTASADHWQESWTWNNNRVYGTIELSPNVHESLNNKFKYL